VPAVRKGRKLIGAAVVLLVAVVGGFVAIYRSRHHPAGGPGTTELAPEDERETRWRGFAAQDPTIVYPGGPPPGPRPAPAAAPALDAGAPAAPLQDEAVMDKWRHGILEKNADVVVDLDSWFRAEPARFAPQLEVLAAGDPVDRIRAFSTRVLGNYKNIKAVGVFRRLMGDGSEYVRGNAAWAIGELADKPGGREAAADALGDLHRLQESDPSPDVRRAAEAALKKLQ
jgi:hypothetical protein